MAEPAMPQKSPYAVELQPGDYWWCACGQSKNQPFCDGSHKLAKSEETGKLYWYDDSGKRQELADAFPGIRTF